MQTAAKQEQPTIERTPYCGYALLLKELYSDSWRFRLKPDLFFEAQAELASLLSDAAKISFIVDEVDQALARGLKPRQAFVIQHRYGLNPDLGNPKNDTVIAKQAPRADGGIRLHRSRIRQIAYKVPKMLFEYQQENPIAGLSFNPKPLEGKRPSN